MTQRSSFYTSIRTTLFKGLSQPQVDGIEAILDEWEKRELADLRWLAYILATVYHETAHTFQPIEEYGKGQGRSYGKKLKMGGGPGKRIPYTTPDQLYYGRGFVQLTWYENYAAMGHLLNVDLLNHPERALDLKIATQILFEGMTRGESHFGDFTGRSLDQFFNATTEDWIGARKIINGLDAAERIAGYAKQFLAALG